MKTNTTELLKMWETLKAEHTQEILLIRDDKEYFTFNDDAITLCKLAHTYKEDDIFGSGVGTPTAGFSVLYAESILSLIANNGYPVYIADTKTIQEHQTNNTTMKTTTKTTSKTTSKTTETIQHTENKNTSRAALKSLCSQLQAAAKQAGVAKTINTLLREHYNITGEVHTYEEWKAAGAAVRKGAKAYALWGNPVTTKKGYTFFPIRYVFTTEQVHQNNPQA